VIHIIEYKDVCVFTILEHYTATSAALSAAIPMGTLIPIGSVAITADTTFTYPTIFNMFKKISIICNKKVDRQDINRFYNISLKYNKKLFISKSVSCIIPLLGNLANYNINSYLYKKIGWVFFKILQSDNNIGAMLAKDIHSFYDNFKIKDFKNIANYRDKIPKDILHEICLDIINSNDDDSIINYLNKLKNICKLYSSI
jgi:hypothetical protein